MSSNNHKKRKASATVQDATNPAKITRISGRAIKQQEEAPVSNGNAAKTNGELKTSNDTASDNNTSDYEPLSVGDIRDRIVQLSSRVPMVPPEGLDDDDELQVKDWATQLQAVVEEFNLLLCCISAATYKWGSERSGAADQNLSVLSGELANAQEQISSTVTPRLTNVLAPVVDLVVDRTETVTQTNSENEKVETKQNYFSRQQVDPAFLKLCRTILCRNSKLLRQVVLANFHKIDKCIGDYMDAQLKDSQHDSRGFAY